MLLVDSHSERHSELAHDPPIVVYASRSPTTPWRQIDGVYSKRDHCKRVDHEPDTVGAGDGHTFDLNSLIPRCA